MMTLTSQKNLQTFHSDAVPLCLPKGHCLPIEKYTLLRERLQSGGIKHRWKFCTPNASSDKELLLVHTESYLKKLEQGKLSLEEQRRIGLPWSPQMMESARRSTGSALAAPRTALTDGARAQTAVETQHAFADHSQGCCMFNDVAVAASVWQSDRFIRSTVVIDLDVHQGNASTYISPATRWCSLSERVGNKTFRSQSIIGTWMSNCPGEPLTVCVWRSCQICWTVCPCQRSTVSST